MDDFDDLVLETDQREHERYSVSMTLRYSAGRGICVGNVCDIGPGGTLIQGDRGFEAGTPITLWIGKHPGVELSGVVRRSFEDRGNHKMGIEFVERTPETEQAVRRLIQSCYWNIDNPT